jgi:hypothetical protein
VGASISILLKRYCHGMNTFCAKQWTNVCLCLSNFFIDLQREYVIVTDFTRQFKTFLLIVLYHCVLILCTYWSNILHNIYFRRHGPALRFERRVLSSVGTSGNQRKGLSRKTSTCRGWQMTMPASSGRTTWNTSLFQSV